MESITIKVEESFAKEIERAMKPDYNTLTEFVREAIRDKLKMLRDEKLVSDLLQHFGAAKTKTSYAEERMVRELVGKKIAKHFGIKLD